MFSLLWQHVKCAAKHIDNELYVALEKIQNHMNSLSTKVSSKCLRIRLPKGLPPKSTWVLREAYDFYITKGPKERLKSCFNTERCIVAVNLMVSDNCHDKARPTYRSAMRWGPKTKQVKKSKELSSSWEVQKCKVRSKGRMLVLISTSWPNGELGPWLASWSGMPSPKDGWWGPVTQCHI